jgi:hypothetical protein
MKRKSKSTKNTHRKATIWSDLKIDQDKPASGQLSSQKGVEPKKKKTGPISLKGAKFKRSKNTVGGQRIRMEIKESSQNERSLQGSKNAAQELTSQQRKMLLEPTTRTMALNAILPRINTDLRIPKLEDVYQLAKSIDKNGVGIIHFITVDRRNHLISGFARLLALRILNNKPGLTRSSYIERIIEKDECLSDGSTDEIISLFNNLPHYNNDEITVVQTKFCSLNQPKLARKIEIAENDKRRNFDYQAIVARYLELVSQGHARCGSKPKPGKHSAYTLTARDFSCNTKTVQRALQSLMSPNKNGSKNEKEAGRFKKIWKSLIRIESSLSPDKRLTDCTASEKAKLRNKCREIIRRLKMDEE